MIRAFAALPLPDAIRSALVVQQFLLPLRDPLPAESLHITLAFFGEQPEPVLEDLHLALTALRVPDFALMLTGIGHFGRDHPRSVHAIVAPNPPLMAVQRKVETLARRSGIAVPAQRYVPHVTLARFRTPAPDLLPTLARAIATARFTAGPWQADRIVLYRSSPGARYDALADYPLTR